MNQRYSFRHLLFYFSLLLVAFPAVAQELGVEARMTNPGATLRSGFYQGADLMEGHPDPASHPWMHLIIGRHSNLDNHHALQIASSFSVNDRLFFRKIAAGNHVSNPEWMEVATRRSNTFTGRQVFDPQSYGGFDIGNPNTASGGYTSLIFGISAATNGYGFLQAVKSAGSAYGNVVLNQDGGNVLIGKAEQGNGSYRLDVAGKVRAGEIVVNTTGADFVFEQGYKLPSLTEVEKFVQDHKHLPAIPSAATMQKEGTAVGEMQTLLLQKVEELTLYIIEQNKQLQEQGRHIQELQRIIKDSK